MNKMISKEVAERIVLTQKQYALEAIKRYGEYCGRTVSIEFLKGVVTMNLNIILNSIHTFEEV